MPRDFHQLQQVIIGYNPGIEQFLNIIWLSVKLKEVPVTDTFSKMPEHENIELSIGPELF